MNNETSAAPRNRTMILAINVPAYVTIDVPDEVGDTAEALIEYARGEFAAWWSDEDNMTLEVEWGCAIRETERVVTADECDENGVSTKNLLRDIDLDPPPDAFKAVAGAENACRDGLVVEAYLLASTAHITSAERDQLESGVVGNPHIVVSAICEHGWILHLNERLVSGEIELDQALENLSEGFAGVVRRAITYGLPFVRFDADGPTIEGLPVYPDQ